MKDCKEIISIEKYITDTYGEHVLKHDHPDFDLDIYMMYMCRSIEKEMMDYKWQQDKAYNETLKSIENIITVYKRNNDGR